MPLEIKKLSFSGRWTVFETENTEQQYKKQEAECLSDNFLFYS